MDIITRATLQSLFEQAGPKAFTKRILNMLQTGEIKPNQINFGYLYEAMGSPGTANRILGDRLIEDDAIDRMTEAAGPVLPQAFTAITGSVIHKTVQEAYEMAQGVGMQLVTVFESTHEEETIVGFTEDYEMKQVYPGAEYESAAMGEKYHKIANRKFGRMIAITEEIRKFDQTGKILMAAQRIGEHAKAKQEKIIMQALLGAVTSGDYASWRPAGTATTLYGNTSTDPYSNSTSDNLISDALADETDLAAASVELGDMKDEYDNPIIINATGLLTAKALEPTAAKIVRSTQSIEKTVPSGTYGFYSGTPLFTSPYVDSLKGSTYWLYGDFKRQFVYTRVFPLQTMQMKPNTDMEFTRDIIAAFKTRFMGGCGAVSNRYVIQSSGGG